MAEHVPHFKPGADVTLEASAAITGGRLVSISGDKTVAQTSANDKAWVGVATTDAANGDKLTVTSGGVQELVASAAITAGDLVVPAADGKVASLADASASYAQAEADNARAVVGVALIAADAADDPVLVKFAR